jgi:TonB-linked SusC/RagA family outer membrane protein
MKRFQNQRLISKSRLWTKATAIFAVLFFSLLAAAPAYAQQTITGRVSNEAGDPVVGASVIVKGTSTGTTTDNGGNFSISAASGSTLIISSVNYTEQQVRVGSSNSVTVRLLSSSRSDLDEVVVIGYGTARKKDVTGSTVSVRGETLNEIKAPNIINQLQGRAAGVDIQTNGNQLGTGGQIRIRGNRSLSGGNDPLIVVDGMAYGGSVNDINPDNVASIDVLKDASASAIYGSRGANGVIIITTKRGMNQKAVTSYNGYVGKVNVIDTYRLFNGAEYAQFKADAMAGNSVSAGNSNYQLRAIEQTNLAAGVSTDWQDLLLTTGIRTSHDLAVRGGNDRTTYSFGGGYYKETGVIHDQELNRWSLNINIDHKISNRIKVGVTSFNTLLRSNRLGTNAYGAGTRLGPLFKPYNDDGTLNFKPASTQGVDDAQINPLTSIGNNDLIKAFSRRYQFQHNFYGEIGIIKGLKFRTSFGYGWSQQFNGNYTGPNTVFNVNTNTAFSGLSQLNQEGWQYTLNNSFEYNTTFREKHKLQAQVLQEIQKNHFQQQQFNGTGVPAGFLQDYNWQQVSTINPQGGQFTESALIGYFGRVIYTFDDKYMITANVRADGSSILAPGNQWTSYPAVSVGWNIDKEKFMENVKFVNSLKLRAGWGKGANPGITPYTVLGTLTANFYNFGGGTVIGTNYVNGYLINSATNPNLTWEKTTGLNLGLDFSLFNNRLSGSIEYYNNKTDGILVRKRLPGSLGVPDGQLTNAAKTESNGMEFTISSVNVKTKDFSWSTDFNAFFNREKITALPLGLLRDEANGWFVGEPVSVIFDYKKIGIWQTSEAAQAAVYGAKPGDIKVEDVDKSNSITGADRQIVGNFQPDLVAGLSNRFQYKNFDLNVVMFGRFGQTVIASYLSADGGGGGYPFFLNSRVNQLKVDYWTPTNATNEFPQPDAGVDGLQYTSTLSYRDGSFIKIRTIDLGYNLPSKWLGRSGISSLRVYVSAQNPFILWAPLVRDNLGIDPEGNSGNDNNAGGTNTVGAQGGGSRPVTQRAIIVNMGIPSTRQLLIGVNVKF